MSRTNEWRNVEMELVVELTAELIDTMKPELRDSLLAAVPQLADPDDDTPRDLHVEFRSSGYSDPGRWGSCPDDSQAPEGEDEREMDSVYLMTKVFRRNEDDESWFDCTNIELPRDLQESLFAHFQEQVDAEELPDLDD